MTPQDEQAKRILSNWEDALDEGIENWSLGELQDIFEDRDPAEFL
jgi:hypothetical protein